VRLADLAFRVTERFLYAADFGDLWRVEVRSERHVPIEPRRTYPVCVGGHWGGPPEDCGGPEAFRERRDAAPWRVPELPEAVADAIAAQELAALEAPREEAGVWRGEEGGPSCD
jgi:Plasmid pRiA4b ORF-3-like protein